MMASFSLLGEDTRTRYGHEVDIGAPHFEAQADGGGPLHAALDCPDTQNPSFDSAWREPRLTCMIRGVTSEGEYSTSHVQSQEHFAVVKKVGGCWRLPGRRG